MTAPATDLRSLLPLLATEPALDAVLGRRDAVLAVPDAAQLPCVNIYNSRASFDSSKSYTDLKYHTYNLAIDCYSVSCAEPGERADFLSAARLDYLWSQVFLTLSAEENWFKGLSAVVKVARFTDWAQKIIDIGSKEAAAQVLAIQSTLELQFEEPTETVLGAPLEEIVTSLEIDDQFISPFITAQYA